MLPVCFSSVCVYVVLGALLAVRFPGTETRGSIVVNSDHGSEKLFICVVLLCVVLKGNIRG